MPESTADFVRIVGQYARAEIGSYLGLKLETVSRTFFRFQAQQLIGVRQKQVRILDLPGLKAMLDPKR